MSKAKYKVVVKPTKQKSGTVLARMPVSVEKNANPNGKKMYQTTAQLTVRAGKKRNGEPRRKLRH